LQEKREQALESELALGPEPVRVQMRLERERELALGPEPVQVQMEPEPVRVQMGPEPVRVQMEPEPEPVQMEPEPVPVQVPVQVQARQGGVPPGVVRGLGWNRRWIMRVPGG
jgi:hypothetical protein